MKNKQTIHRKIRAKMDINVFHIFCSMYFKGHFCLYLRDNTVFRLYYKLLTKKGDQNVYPTRIFVSGDTQDHAVERLERLLKTPHKITACLPTKLTPKCVLSWIREFRSGYRIQGKNELSQESKDFYKEY